MTILKYSLVSNNMNNLWKKTFYSPYCQEIHGPPCVLIFLERGRNASNLIMRDGEGIADIWFSWKLN